ncbi:MAG: tetratricopeptide repeat protein, partial [Sulfurimonadaceae bacterium]|nr:tetratricopeptide repeat protein [Sulfurimonadaceae bacterium]
FYGLVLLSLFPSINLHVDEINRVFGGDLSDDLSILSKKGWLISVDKEVFKVHQIIKEFFLFNYPMHSQDITPMIKYYLVNIEWNETDHPSEQKKYMIFVKSLIDSLKGYDEGIIILANNVAMLYRYFGFFEIALKYMLIVKDFDEKNNNDTNLAQTYNNIGNVYHKLGDIDNTIKYFELSMDIREKYNDPLLSESYLAMGSLLSENGYVDIAKKYLDILENMEINEKSFIPISNLGILIYTKLKKPKLVMKYINAALSFINNKIVDENHLYIAYTYNNISLFYEKLLQDYNLAIHYKQKQDELMKKNFSEEDKDSKNIKTDLERLNKLNSL